MNGMSSHEWRGPHHVIDRVEELEKALQLALEFVYTRTNEATYDQLVNTIKIVMPSVKDIAAQYGGKVK